MVKIHLAYTSLINPPGSSPILTQSQVWSGLQRKIRYAQEFVPIILSCDVLEDKDGVITREVRFAEGAGPKPKAREVCRGLWPSWVDFEQEDGTTIRNIISDGPSGDASDLHLTYMFELDFPKVEAGTEGEAEQVKKFKAGAKMAVEKSIETIRKMVMDGRIEK